MNKKAIIIKDISKLYPLKSNRSVNSSVAVMGQKAPNFSALKNLHLDVNRGEIIGIIGPNGAGKSTLLKLIGGITLPSSGTIEVNGFLVSILEVGVGFLPDLTGYENIIFSGRLHGLSKKEIISKIDRITEMFGFREFMDIAVKYYSTGMYMRLAFALISQIKADIYLLDEVLGVGDFSFQHRVLNEIREMKKRNATVCIVTHAPMNIADICDRMVLLNKSELIFAGTPASAINEYQKLINSPNVIPSQSECTLDESMLAKKKISMYTDETIIFEIEAAKLFSMHTCSDTFNVTEDITAEIHFKYKLLTSLTIRFLIKNFQESVLFSKEISVDSAPEVLSCKLKINLPRGTLNPATYKFDIFVEDGNKLICCYSNVFIFKVIDINKPVSFGYLNPPVSIELERM